MTPPSSSSSDFSDQDQSQNPFLAGIELDASTQQLMPRDIPKKDWDADIPKWVEEMGIQNTAFDDDGEAPTVPDELGAILADPKADVLQLEEWREFGGVIEETDDKQVQRD
ncbi:MAG: hypothetical protein KC474_09930 [Cyanobacteria bacterium HKST-UBA04]|nr:hypothetical protein [Cyanobacteria bacterium HKST-UBA04]